MRFFCTECAHFFHLQALLGTWLRARNSRHKHAFMYICFTANTFYMGGSATFLERGVKSQGHCHVRVIEIYRYNFFPSFHVLKFW